MSDKEQADTVSVEAFERIKKERDELKEQTQKLQGEVEASRKVSQAESFLRRKGIPEDDLDARMELISPHLAQMNLDSIQEELSSDRFKLVVSGTTTNVEAEAEGEADEAPASPAPPTPGFGGPSPSGDDLPPGQKKFTLKSPEVQAILQRNDKAALEQLYKEGRIQEPVRNY